MTFWPKKVTVKWEYHRGLQNSKRYGESDQEWDNILENVITRLIYSYTSYWQKLWTANRILC